jgi:aryl-alcohol dehydrogenase-like predicted oxidoreductase
LRALRTDYVDVLLLHAPTLAELTPELLEYLGSVVESGRARAVGLAADVEVVAGALRLDGRFPDVVQIPFGNMPRLPQIGALGLVTHSVIASLRQFDERARKELAGRMSVPQSDLVPIALAAAVAANPRGVTLFATTHLERLRANVLAASASDAEERVSQLSSVLLEACTRPVRTT